MSPADGSTSAPAIVMLVARDLVDSPYQPAGRSVRDVESLAASIREHGILEPLIVRRAWDHPARPIGGGLFEIVCGHRRKCAAIFGEDAFAAPAREVPCIIRDMSDEEAETIVLVENGQRVDLTPLEEAESIARLRIKRGWDVERIAEKISKTPSTVRRRLLLMDLVDSAAEALAAGKLRLGVAEELAVLDKEAQLSTLKQLLKNSDDPDFDPCPPFLARIHLDMHRRRLADALWALTDATLVPSAGPCSTCPKNTSTQKMLFEDGVAPGDRCLDGACWGSKVDAYREREAARASEDDAGPDQDDHEAEREHRDSKPANKPAPPVKPAVDLEPAARAAAIERAIPAIIKSLSGPGRKLDDIKLWKLLLQTSLRSIGMAKASDAFTRRGLPDDSLGGSAAISKMASPHELLGLLFEMLFVSGPEWTGAAEDESPLTLAAKFARVDLAKMKSEELLALQEEAASRSRNPKPVTKKLSGHKTVAEFLEPSCRVCSCTLSKPCDAGAGRTCISADGAVTLCSVCKDLGDAFVELLEDGPYDEGDAIGCIYDGTDLESLTEKRVGWVLDDLMAGVHRVANIIRIGDGKISLKQAPLPMPTKAGKVKAGAPAEAAANLDELQRGMPLEWSTGDEFDRSGSPYTHLIRHPDDPERSDIRALPEALRDREAAWRRRLKKQPVDTFKPLILTLLGDGVARTFNRIGVELLDKTADVLLDTPPDLALWALVKEGAVEHTTKAPIQFRRTSTSSCACNGGMKGDVTHGPKVCESTKTFPAPKGKKMVLEEPSSKAAVCDDGNAVPAEKPARAGTRPLTRDEREILDDVAIEGNIAHAKLTGPKKSRIHESAISYPLFAAMGAEWKDARRVPFRPGGFHFKDEATAKAALSGARESGEVPIIEAKSPRSKAIKGVVHHTLKFNKEGPARGRPKMLKLCEQKEPDADFAEKDLSPDVSCTDCRTAYETMKGAAS